MWCPSGACNPFRCNGIEQTLSEVVADANLSGEICLRDFKKDLMTLSSGHYSVKQGQVQDPAPRLGQSSLSIQISGCTN